MHLADLIGLGKTKAGEHWNLGLVDLAVDRFEQIRQPVLDELLVRVGCIGSRLGCLPRVEREASAEAERRAFAEAREQEMRAETQANRAKVVVIDITGVATMDTAVANHPGGFNYKQFASNVVFRWEYRPGSTLFLVWNQGRQGGAGAEGTAGFGGDLRDLFLISTRLGLLRLSVGCGISLG